MRGVVTYASLQRVLDHYRAGLWRADMAVVSGDLVQDDSAEAYRHFRQLLEPLRLPVLCLPGNHDVRPVMREMLAGEPFGYCGVLEQDAWLVACLDSCVEGGAGGLLAESELRRLESAIDEAAAPHVAVFLHHPPVALGSLWLDRVGLDGGERVLQRLAASGRIRLVAFGHAHQDFVGAHGRAAIVGTPSTCRQFAPGADVFAVDDSPPAYRHFELAADGTVNHELVWVN